MILLLGATGLLGHNVLRLLLERGEAVRVLARPGSRLFIGNRVQNGAFCTPDPDFSESGGQNTALCTPEIIRGSILDYGTLLGAARGCSAIINCAGTTDMSLPQTADFYPVNRDLPILLCRVLEETGIPTLVHTSTANTITPGPREHPTDEFAPFAAPFDRSPYAISKKEGEERLLAWAAEHPERRVVIVNPGFMLGAWDAKPSSGTLMLAACRRPAFRPGKSGVRGRPLMAGPGGGKSFLHVQDAATAICNALGRGQTGRYLLTGQSLTLKEFYALQARVCGYRQRFFTLPDALMNLAGRLGDLAQKLGIRTMVCRHNTDQLLIEEWYDCGKAERELGLPHTPIPDAIRDFFEWHSAFPGVHN
ncbi:MAG: NAD-dependent epimerase/dehydratase family protein [Bacteroidales bacterium]|nr:NAD-dependent epimerase/dehydratase family protein [Bacteroidales bacterium]